MKNIYPCLHYYKRLDDAICRRALCSGLRLLIDHVGGSFLYDETVVIVVMLLWHSKPSDPEMDEIAAV